MAVGKYQLQLGADQLVSGMSSSDYATDGALGVSSRDINPFIIPGAIQATAIPSTPASVSNLSDNIIASCEDATSNANSRLMVGSAGNLYTLDASQVITKVATGVDTANYVNVRTDIAIQSDNGGLGKAFITHGTDIGMWDGSTTYTESWWTTKAYYTGTTHPPALGGNPHPLINYNTNLWVADGYTLHNIIGNAANITSSTLCVNLNFFNLELFAKIYALGIDPGTGLMMISFQTVSNQSGLISTQNFIGLYDGTSSGLRRRIPVDDLVTSFTNVGGVVYVGYGRRIGQWNGNGITYLRQLKNVTYASTLMPYKQRVTSVANILLVADGTSVLAYGEAVAGKKGWFYVIDNRPSGSAINIDALMPLGNSKFGTASATKNLTVTDISSSTGASNCKLYFNNIYMPRPIFVRRMRIITGGIVATGSANMVANIVTEKGINIPIATANSQVTVPAATTQYVFDFDFSQGKCQAVQPVISLLNAPSVIVRVIIYYDVAE